MRIRILGPLRVHSGSREIHIAGARDRALLAMLLLNAGDPVPVHTLTEIIWGWTDRLPRDPRNEVQKGVSRLRKLLRGAGAPPQVIVTDPNGYRIELLPGSLDLHEFRERWQRAREAVAAEDLNAASELYRDCLSLWRGPALADIDNQRLRDAAAVVDEERVRALEERFEVELALGRSVELIPVLRDVVRQFPYQEKLHGALMVALYRAGRQADALAVYRDLRALLRSELAIEVSEELQQLHREILDHHPRWGPPAWHPEASANVDGGFRPAVPRTLPPDIPTFVGREKELDQIQELLTGGVATGVPVVVISGAAGVGKTALSVRAAHLVRDRYPDGQLFVDLRGFDRTAALEPTAVLGRFLRVLGVSGTSIPGSLDERVEVYRSLLADRRVLVVLDNAATEGQVVPLIPSSESCAVIINSRRRLGALDARTISLNLLDTTQATALVARVVGAERVEAEPAATADLVRLCGHLPLAIRVAAGRLATRPYWNVARMVDRLADEGRRLDNLAHGSLDVRASIMISYNSLSPAERHLLRGLGDLNLAEIAPWASAALLDAPVPRAEEVIDRLFDAQLIDVLDHGSVGYSRYRLHDLVRLVAQEQAGRAEPASARRSARERAYGSWLAVTEAVHRHVFGGDYETVRSSALRWTPDQDLIAVICAQPMRWFDLEQESLVAVVRRSIEDGLFEVAWSLTAVATRLVAVRGYYHDWSAVLRELQVATRKAGDVLGEAVTTCRLGYVLADLYDTKGAREQYQRALLLFQKTGNEHGCALVQLYLGAVERREGNLDAALRHYRAALPGLHTHGDLGAEAYALRSLAQVYMDRKEHGDAVEYFDRALAVARAAGSLRSEAQVTFWKGMYAMRLERYGAARDHFHDTLALARQVDDRYGVAQAIRGIGLCHLHQGDAAAATSALREALQVISQPMPTIIEIRIREALAAIEAGMTKA